MAQSWEKVCCIILYGSSFAIGATALVIIIGARVIQSIYQIYSNFLMATDHVKHQFFGLFAGIVVNVILACILVPEIGLSGAAIASISNVFISTIICRYYLGQDHPDSYRVENHQGHRYFSRDYDGGPRAG